jgi:hypothetical protein
VNLSTGSEIEIEEKLHINYLSLNASLGSDFEVEKEVIIETAKVRISSGASVEIWGAREISGNVSSGGRLEVCEKTTRTNVTTSSGGEVYVDC